MPLPLLALAAGGAGAGLLGGYLGAQSQRRALGQQASALENIAGGITATPTNIQGLFGNVAVDPTTGELTSSLSPELMSLFSGAVSGLGEGIAAPPTDLAALAGEQVGLLQELVRPQQERAEQGLVERLYSQGALGSTGGAEAIRALEEVKNTQNLQIAQQALGEARATGALQQQASAARTGQLMNLLGLLQGGEQGLFGRSLAGGQFDLQRQLGTADILAGASGARAQRTAINPLATALGGLGTGLFSGALAGLGRG